MAAPSLSPEGFVVSGGRPAGLGTGRVSGETWFFGLADRTWRRLGPPTAAATVAKVSAAAAVARRLPGGWIRQPPGDGGVSGGGGGGGRRMYHGGTRLGGSGALPLLAVSGGTTSTPRATCSEESWLLAWGLPGNESAWLKLPSLPYGHYHHSLVEHGESMFSFGGHLCSETKDGRPFYYLNAVHRLDLREAVQSYRALERSLKAAAAKAAAKAHHQGHEFL